MLERAGTQGFWDFTSSTNYTSAFGVSMPSNQASFVTSGSTTQYFSLSSGPQLFQVNGSAVPEPSSLLLGAVSAMVGVMVALVRLRRET